MAQEELKETTQRTEYFGVQIPSELDADGVTIDVLRASGKAIMFEPHESQKRARPGMSEEQVATDALVSGEAVPAKLDGQSEGDAVALMFTGKFKRSETTGSTAVLYSYTKDRGWIAARSEDMAKIKISKKN